MTVENAWFNRNYVHARGGGAGGMKSQHYASAMTVGHGGGPGMYGGGSQVIYGGTIGTGNSSRHSRSIAAAAGSRASRHGAIPFRPASASALSRTGSGSTNSAVAVAAAATPAPAYSDAIIRAGSSSSGIARSTSGAVPIISGDVAYQMSIGRAAVPSPSGDGTMRIVKVPSAYRGMTAAGAVSGGGGGGVMSQPSFSLKAGLDAVLEEATAVDSPRGGESPGSATAARAAAVAANASAQAASTGSVSSKPADGSGGSGVTASSASASSAVTSAPNASAVAAVTSAPSTRLPVSRATGTASGGGGLSHLSAGQGSFYQGSLGTFGSFRLMNGRG